MKITIATMLLFAAAAVQAQKNLPRQMPEDVAIFAVTSDSQSFSIDPVVIVHYGQDQRYKTIPALNDPIPEKGSQPSDYSRFQKLFYRPGTMLSLFSGGEKIGKAKVLKSEIAGSDGGYRDLSTAISYDGKRIPLLAANTASEIPGHTSTRRDASEEETSVLRELATKWLSDYGLDRELLQKGSFGKVLSATLRENAGAGLIGRFDVQSKHAIFHFFVVAEKVASSYTLTLTDPEIQNDIED